MPEVRDAQPLTSSEVTDVDNTVLPTVDWYALLDCIEQRFAADYPASHAPQALVLSLAAPLRGWMQRRLLQMLQQLQFAASQQLIWQAAVQEYADSRLSGWLSKIAIYELNLARQQQLLSGDSPEARYQFYLLQLIKTSVTGLPSLVNATVLYVPKTTATVLADSEDHRLQFGDNMV